MPLNDRTFFGRGIVQRARDGKCTSVCMARDVRVFLHDDAERAQLPNKAGKVTRCVVERLVAAMEVATVEVPTAVGAMAVTTVAVVRATATATAGLGVVMVAGAAAAAGMAGAEEQVG